MDANTAKIIKDIVYILNSEGGISKHSSGVLEKLLHEFFEAARAGTQMNELYSPLTPARMMRCAACGEALTFGGSIELTLIGNQDGSFFYHKGCYPPPSEGDSK